MLPLEQYSTVRPTQGHNASTETHLFTITFSQHRYHSTIYARRKFGSEAWGNPLPLPKVPEIVLFQLPDSTRNNFLNTLQPILKRKLVLDNGGDGSNGRPAGAALHEGGRVGDASSPRLECQRQVHVHWSLSEQPQSALQRWAIISPLPSDNKLSRMSLSSQYRPVAHVYSIQL